MDHTVVHFEIPANDTEKLKKFYFEVFGWKIEKGSEDMSGGMEYWLLGTVPADKQMRPIRPGVNGGMYKKTKETKDMKPIVYISVESADEYINKIKKLGGKVIVPKQEVPHVGWTAIAVDLEGNPFAIMQPMEM
jgi:predicted enzyme related to lactoylglutathione lyase